MVYHINFYGLVIDFILEYLQLSKVGDDFAVSNMRVLMYYNNDIHTLSTEKCTRFTNRHINNLVIINNLEGIVVIDILWPYPTKMLVALSDITIFMGGGLRIIYLD